MAVALRGDVGGPGEARGGLCLRLQSTQTDVSSQEVFFSRLPLWQWEPDGLNLPPKKTG